MLGETGTRFHLILGHGYQELDFVQIGDAETMLRIVRELQQPISYFTTDRPRGGERSGTVFFRSFKSKTRTSNRAFGVWRKWVGQVSTYVDF